MKNSTIKFISASTVALLALAGCSKSDESAENLPVAEPVVTQITAVCDDHSLKNRLNDALQSALLDASLSRLTGMSELQMQDMETKVRSQLGTVSFDLQNVSNTDTGCSADVYITPSAQDMMAAENLLAQRNINLADHIKAAGGELIAGRIVAQGMTYKIVDNKAVLDNPQHPIFGAAADALVMAASQMDAAAATDTGAMDAAAVAAAVAAPVVAMRPQVIDRSTSEVVASDATADTTPVSRPTTTTQPKAQTQSKPKPKTEQKAQTQSKPRAEQKAQAKPKAEPQKATAKPVAKAETAKSSDNDGVTRTITPSKQDGETRQTITRTVTNTEKKAEPKQESKQQAKPQAKQEQKPAVPVGEIVIVEGNDTY
ncbi:hypothetical protein [Moraxella pluranimalium]|uniref:Lipoprotein n=1 Tax=Moraxella pluranimalium TaxID=470453 RepID=A0A1T0CGP2_9GAMM|nr:hypothetical protein [Moraxella pluranimalium]OOS21311.1 hypothetical protein B0680_10005 [Moraxella pluranimalium]